MSEDKKPISPPQPKPPSRPGRTTDSVPVRERRDINADKIEKMDRPGSWPPPQPPDKK